MEKQKNICQKRMSFCLTAHSYWGLMLTFKHISLSLKWHPSLHLTISLVSEYWIFPLPVFGHTGWYCIVAFSISVLIIAGSLYSYWICEKQWDVLEDIRSLCIYGRNFKDFIENVYYEKKRCGFQTFFAPK